MIIIALFGWISENITDASVYAGGAALILLAILLYTTREDW